MYAAVRQFGLVLSWVWYRRVRLGGEVPAGPLVVVTNHSNGLVDGALAMWPSSRPLRFLVKFKVFRMPFVAWLARSTRAIPIYRKKDNVSMTANEDSFRAAFEALEQGEAISVFPEGTSHSEPSMIPFKTGAARLVLGAEARNGFELGVKLLPVGLVYSERNAFRSRVHVWVGEPVGVAHLEGEYARDDRETVRRLTGDIDSLLRRVTLNLERHEDGPLLELGAELWDEGEAERPARLRDLALGLRWLRAHRPDRARRVVRDAERLLWRMRANGLSARDLDTEPDAAWFVRLAARTAGVLLLALPTMILACAAWAPVIGAGQLIARSKKMPADKYVTAWLLAGVLLVPLWLACAAVGAGLLAGWGAAALAPVALAGLAVFGARVWQRRAELQADLGALLNLSPDTRLRASLRRDRDALWREMSLLVQLRADTPKGVKGAARSA